MPFQGLRPDKNICSFPNTSINFVMKNTRAKPEPSSEEDKDTRKQIQLIHKLAVRLPWIVVFFVILTAIITLIEVFLKL
jgi:hypothetical protein